MTLKSPRPKRKHTRFPKARPLRRRHLEQIFEDEIRYRGLLRIPHRIKIVSRHR